MQFRFSMFMWFKLDIIANIAIMNMFAFWCEKFRFCLFFVCLRAFELSVNGSLHSYWLSKTQSETNLILLWACGQSFISNLVSFFKVYSFNSIIFVRQSLTKVVTTTTCCLWKHLHLHFHCVHITAKICGTFSKKLANSF